MNTTLIITTYNWKEALSLTLTSALEQTLAPGEILVADDGSTEDTGLMVAELAARSSVPIRHIWQEDKGFRLAKSRNIPFVVIRSISDIMEEELPLDFNVFQGTKGWVPGIVSVLRRPSRLIALCRLWKQSNRAALQLTRFFEKYLIGLSIGR